ncbi:hypothetical protein [Microbacterium kunmingense]|uniref:hypothetical protein n=1 Tax=Microbacterium kunmingense TaxID=2915939 RepID=UPI002004913D|nr:hypothetical protein [Microbacterium kunmingense]
MLLALWLTLCLVIALLFRHRPVVLIGILMAIKFAVPSVASSAITGLGGSQLHPSAYLLAACLTVLVLTTPHLFGRELGRNFWLYFALIVGFLLAVTVTAATRPPSSLLSLIDSLGFGIVLFLIVRVAFLNRPGSVCLLALTFVWLASIEAMIALGQWATGRTWFWESQMETYYWYSPVLTRATGTVGAWLDLATLLTVAIPLAVLIERQLVRLVVVLVLLAGVLVTESRLSFVVALAAAAYAVLRRQAKMEIKFVSLAAAAFGAWLLLTSPLVSGVLDRFAGDTLSTYARQVAIEHFSRGVGAQPFFGTGYNSSFDERETILSSFENGYLMYVWDFGWLTTLLIFGAVVSQPIIALLRGGAPYGVIPASAIALLLMASHSGLQTRGPSMWILFFAIALCAVDPAVGLPREASKPEAKKDQVVD